jgi:Ca2+-binding RTX toxin-like protein
VIRSFTSSSPECGGAAEGQPVTVSGTFTDVGVQDTHTALINWGDGTTSFATISESGGSGTLSASHTYAVGGIYPITVKLTDDDTLSAVAASQAVVTGVGVKNGTLYVIGTENDDHVTINQQGDGTYMVHADFLSGNRLVSGAGVTQIVVVLCDGNDHFSMAGSISTPTLIDGGEGNDQLNGGNGRNVILGGPGDDMLIGGSDKDLLIGGTGSDRIVANKDDDTLVGATTSADGDYGMLSGFFTGAFNINTVGKQDDGVRDVLTGNAGTDTFVVSDEDVITDQPEQEIFV